MRMPVPTFRSRELDPFDGFRRDFEDMMRDFGRKSPLNWAMADPAAGLAALDVSETPEAVEIATELPGVSESEVHLSVEGQAIVISGEKKSETTSEDKKKAWHVVERSYGAFRRVVPLNFTPDAGRVTANFDKGVLHVKVGKPPEMVAKKVAIPIQKGG